MSTGGMARQILRKKAKLEFKKLKKTNPNFKQAVFSEFFKHYRAGLLQLKAPPTELPAYLEEETNELDSLILDDEIEEEIEIDEDANSE